MTELRTERLVLRQWRDTDAEPWARLNADAQVMEYFPSTLTREESDSRLARHRSTLSDRGWGIWAVEVIDAAPFVGFVGLSEVDFDAAFTPAVEIGWRLSAAHWGNGYASEAARVVLRYAFEELAMLEVVSFTAATNTPSEAVMVRIGMTAHPAGPFDHPDVDPGHPLERHVLYRISNEEWLTRERSDQR